MGSSGGGESGVATSFLSGALNSIGLEQSQYSEQARLDYQIRAAAQNEKMAYAAALASRERGNQQEMASRMKYGALRGEQATALGGSGIVATSGSALDILANTKAMSDYDAAIIHNNAAREAWAHDIQGLQQREYASLLKATKGDVKNAYYMKQIGNLVGTVGSMAGSMGGGGGGGG